MNEIMFRIFLLVVALELHQKSYFLPFDIKV